MEHDNFSVRQLELDKILDRVAEKASCRESADMVRALVPESDLRRVRERLADTQAAFDLSVRYGTPSFRGLKVITAQLKRARSGGVLTMRELLDTAEMLSVIRRVEAYRISSSEMSTCLDGLLNSFTSNKYLEDRITSAIISEDEMSDNASPALADIRRGIRAAAEKARNALDRIVKSSSMQKFLQEQVVTIRGGRFVIPVKSEYKSEIPGLVHDTSSSGGTLFIEPMATVEANNELKVLKNREKAEIDRILGELSAEVGNFSEKIERDNLNLVKADFIFTKAAAASDMNGVSPILNESGKVDLADARHPLIDRNSAVPINIYFGDSFDTLIITGPNTGGKTVALKTVGLLTLMAMCGLMIPAREGSEISVFKSVFADIGDEQSIEQSLSTFSAHMTNISRIISAADERSLVLFDELGSGTDPVEGAALAATVIEYLREKKCRIVATTHYAELKVYALETDGVENASCEFDVKTLRPTYRLLIGVPGKSNAFAISERLGLPQELVDRARQRVSEENSRFERVITQLEESRREAEKMEKAAAAERNRADALLADAKKQAEKIRADAEREAEKARTEAKRIIGMTRARSEQLINEIDGLRKTAEKERQAEMLSAARSSVKSSIRKMEDEADPVRRPETASSGYVLPRKLKAGDTVSVNGVGKKATVLRVSEEDGTAQVQAGMMTMKVPLAELRLEEEGKKSAPPARGSFRRTAERQTSAEIDVRGKTVDEAVIDIDRFIDGALMSNISVITVIHGKGTGALRTGVQKYLKNHRNVKSIRLGNFGEGDAGVTVVELK